MIPVAGETHGGQQPWIDQRTSYRTRDASQPLSRAQPPPRQCSISEAALSPPGPLYALSSSGELGRANAFSEVFNSLGSWNGSTVMRS